MVLERTFHSMLLIKRQPSKEVCDRVSLIKASRVQTSHAELAPARDDLNPLLLKDLFNRASEERPSEERGELAYGLG